MHAIAMNPRIRFVDTPEEMDRVAEFRYRIYVEEMRREQMYADHARRRIFEPFDRAGVNWYAEDRDQIVGVIRTNFARDTDLGYYVTLFGLDSVGEDFPARSLLTTKLMILPEYRSGTLALQLAATVYQFGVDQGMRYNFIDCNAHLEVFFQRMGFRTYWPKVVHPEYGEVLPLRADMLDIAYLDSIGSPILRLLRSPRAMALPRRRPTPISSHSQSSHLQIVRDRNSKPMNASEPTIEPNPSTSNNIPHFSATSEKLMADLDSRMRDVLNRVEAREFWKVVTSPETDLRLVRLVMREVYLEIYSYQKHAIEGALSAIARFPRSVPIRMIKAMLRHQAEEFDHGEMALRDYVRVGGDEHYAREQHRISTASFAAASIWRMIGDYADPFCYLGALYPFEGLTPIVSERIKASLVPRNFPVNALEFVEFHSTEDPKHTELVRHLIQEVATRYPESEGSIREGIDRFLAVYPEPVWEIAYRRALVEFAKETEQSVAA